MIISRPVPIPAGSKRPTFPREFINASCPGTILLFQGK
jgi:hypothetical protein